MPESRILLGVIGRPHGVRGLVRVTSYADDVTAYGALSDEHGRSFVLRMRGEGVAEIAEVVGGVEVTGIDGQLDTDIGSTPQWSGHVAAGAGQVQPGQDP